MTPPFKHNITRELKQLDGIQTIPQAKVVNFFITGALNQFNTEEIKLLQNTGYLNSQSIVTSLYLNTQNKINYTNLRLSENLRDFLLDKSKLTKDMVENLVNQGILDQSSNTKNFKLTSFGKLIQEYTKKSSDFLDKVYEHATSESSFNCIFAKVVLGLMEPKEIEHENKSEIISSLKAYGFIDNNKILSQKLHHFKKDLLETHKILKSWLKSNDSIKYLAATSVINGEIPKNEEVVRLLKNNNLIVVKKQLKFDYVFTGLENGSAEYSNRIKQWQDSSDPILKEAAFIINYGSIGITPNPNSIKLLLKNKYLKQDTNTNITMQFTKIAKSISKILPLPHLNGIKINQNLNQPGLDFFHLGKKEPEIISGLSDKAKKFILDTNSSHYSRAVYEELLKNGLLENAIRFDINNIPDLNHFGFTIQVYLKSQRELELTNQVNKVVCMMYSEHSFMDKRIAAFIIKNTMDSNSPTRKDEIGFLRQNGYLKKDTMIPTSLTKAIRTRVNQLKEEVSKILNLEPLTVDTINARNFLLRNVPFRSKKAVQILLNLGILKINDTKLQLTPIGRYLKENINN